MADLSVGAVLVDCDGTLAPRRMEVTPRVRRAVSELSQLVPVGIVSSRDHTDIGWLAADLGLTAPQISEGGARIFRAGRDEPLWIRSISPGDATAIVDFLEDAGHTFVAVDGGRRVTTCADFGEWAVTRITADSLIKERAEEISRTLGKAMQGVHTELVVRTDNGRWMVDFTHAEVSKASAATEFARLVDVPLPQIAGVGDSYNDRALLEACGTGIAMGQAPSELLSVADHVVPSAWDDGLAVAIEKHILPRVVCGE